MTKTVLVNDFNIPNALETMRQRGWDSIIVAIDVHGTILKPNYEGLAHVFYPNAVDDDSS